MTGKATRKLNHEDAKNTANTKKGRARFRLESGPLVLIVILLIANCCYCGLVPLGSC